MKNLPNLPSKIISQKTNPFYKKKLKKTINPHSITQQRQL